MNSRVRMRDVVDGTSTTVLLAEIKRGAYPQKDDNDVTYISPGTWGLTNPHTNPNNLAPMAACTTTTTTFSYKGLQYCRSVLVNTLYAHTGLPNNTNRDCVNQGGDQGHVAARSYHHGGVQVAFVDGTVRFIADTINLTTWKALGTRAGEEIIAKGDY